MAGGSILRGVLKVHVPRLVRVCGRWKYPQRGTEGTYVPRLVRGVAGGSVLRGVLKVRMFQGL